MSAGRQNGFTLIGALILTSLMGLGVVAYGELASHAAQREREAELLFRGNQYRLAIEGYYRKDQTYPPSIDELLQDRRFPNPVRHLRKPYPDPITGAPTWGLIEAPGGGIMGVYSKSEAPPIKTAGFARGNESFADAKRYRDWQFFFKPAGG